MKKKPKELIAQQKNCGKRLKSLAPFVVAEDRRLAMAKFGKSYVTISRYLQGNVSNLVLGLIFLNFFTEIVNKRSDELGKTG